MSQSYQGWIVVAVVTALGLLYTWFRSPEPPATLASASGKDHSQAHYADERCSLYGAVHSPGGHCRDVGVS